MEINPHQPSTAPQQTATPYAAMPDSTIAFIPTGKQSAAVLNHVGVELYHIRSYTNIRSDLLAIVMAILAYFVSSYAFGFGILLFSHSISFSSLADSIIGITIFVIAFVFPFAMGFLTYRTISPSFCVALFKPDAPNSPILIVRPSRLFGATHTFQILDSFEEKTEKILTLYNGYKLQRSKSPRLASLRLTRNKDQSYSLTADSPDHSIPSDLGDAPFQNGALLFHSKVPPDMLEIYRERVITLLAIACLNPAKRKWLWQ